MPSRSKITLALLVPAVLATAHPVEKRSGDLQIFADAFLESVTGGTFNSCDSLINLGVSLKITSINIFEKWASSHCYASYHNRGLCDELSAYLTATYYAYEYGWQGVDLFSAIGTVRATKWHGLLSNLCAATGCPATPCTTLTSYWSGYNNIDTHYNVANFQTFHTTGIYALLDAHVDLDLGLGSGSGLHLREVGLAGSGSVYGEEALHSRPGGISEVVKGGVHAGGEIRARHLGVPGVMAAGQGSAEGSGDVKVGHGLVDVNGQGSASGSGYIHARHNALPNIVAAGQGSAQGAGDLKVGHGLGNIEGEGSTHGSGYIHARGLPKIVAAGNGYTQGSGELEVGHGVISASDQGYTAGSGYIHARGAPKIVASGNGYTQGSGEIEIGHGTISTSGQGYTAGSGSIHARSLAVSENTDTQGSGSLNIGHGIVGASGQGSSHSSGGIKISRGIHADGRTNTELYDKINLSHNHASIVGDAHLDASGKVIVTRSGGIPPITGVLTGQGSGSSMDKLNLGKGLGAGSFTQGAGSVLGAASLKRGIAAEGVGYGDVRAGKYVEAQGAGNPSVSKGGVVAAGSGGLKAGTVAAGGEGVVIAH